MPTSTSRTSAPRPTRPSKSSTAATPHRSEASAAAGGFRHLPIKQFLAHLRRRIAFALLLIGGSWALGALAYHGLEDLDWPESFYNAAMILGGMGPVAILKHDVSKWFASLYALYSGVVFLAVAGLVFAPIAHRLLRRFHVEQ